ncbi:MAG: prepilin peptidase [Pseudomonadota bacterium]
MDNATLVYCVLLAFPAAMTFAGFTDMVTMTIPNKLTMFLLAAFLVAAVAVRMPLEQFAVHMAVGGVMLIVMMTLFAFNLLGGGDAKLIVAASLWIGFEHLTMFMFYVALLGGVLSLGILFYRSIMPPTWLARQDWALRLHGQGSGVPYGLAIGGAGLLMFPSTAWFTYAASI